MTPIRCIRGQGNNEADSINSPLISSEAGAVARGRRLINESYAHQKIRSMTAAHKGSNILPGETIALDVARYGWSANVRVESYTISGDSDGVRAAIQCREFTG